MAIKTFINTVEAHTIYMNSIRLDEAYMNSVIVYKRMLELTLEQQQDTFNLRTYINSKNTLNATEITVINNRTQPSMVTGNLYGLNVTFINNGEIQGTNPGNTALNITSSLKFLNNGWIRGAGNNGNDGSKGASGSRGGDGSVKTITYSTSVRHSWTAITNIHNTVNGDPQGWTAYGSPTTGTYKCPCGGSVTIPDGGAKTICGVEIYHINSLTNGILQGYIDAGSCDTGTTATHKIDGSAGGSGGVGGNGGKAGIGQSHTTTRTNGGAGKAGGIGGQPAVAKSWTDPKGVVHYGNRGYKGSNGATGSSGSNGGTWGNNGAAISGWNKTTSGSYSRNINGTRN